MKWPLIALVGLTLMSCGSSKKDAPVGNTIHLENDEELQNAIATSKVFCMENYCPSNVGKLLFWSKSKTDDGYDFGVCSGTLIDSNTLITNRHCVPEDLNTGDDCSDRLIVQFPSDDSLGTSSENIKCSYVAKAYSKDAGGPDIAILKVRSSKYFRKSTKRKAHQMTTSAVHAYTMNPGKGRDGFSGYIYRKMCTIAEQSILTGRMMPDSSDAVIYGSNCDIISGNSGSGVFDSNGDLIGLIHSRIDRYDVKAEFSKVGIKSKLNDYMGIMVNIGCAESYFADGTGDCVQRYIETKEDLNNYIAQEKRRSIFRTLDDTDILAYIGDGLKVEFARDNSYNSYSMNRFSEFETLLGTMFSDASGEVEGKYVWALVK